MKGRRSIMAFVFIISALIVGSFQVTAQATDPGVVGDSGSGAFAASIPQIPGYNAPYPTLATQSSGKVLAKPVQGADASEDLGSRGPSDGFAVTLPQIPGYNAPYPSPAVQALEPDEAFVRSVALPGQSSAGYVAAGPCSSPVCTLSLGPTEAGAYVQSLALAGDEAFVRSIALTGQSPAGYVAAGPCSSPVCTLSLGPTEAEAYARILAQSEQGLVGLFGDPASTPGAAQNPGKVLAKSIRVTDSPSTSIALSFYGPADGFAASVPQIPGYNAPYPVEAAQNPGKVLAKPIRVTDSPSISTALSFYGLADGFATIVPQIPGYNAPYPTQTSQSVGTP